MSIDNSYMYTGMSLTSRSVVHGCSTALKSPFTFDVVFKTTKFYLIFSNSTTPKILSSDLPVYMYMTYNGSIAKNAIRHIVSPF